MRLRFTPKMKLEIEPIPESTWGISLANLLPEPVWDTLRREVYEGFDYTCAICEAADKQLHCHERWGYDDKLRIQKLVGFQCLCVDCHEVKHWGRTVAEAHKNKNNSRLVELTKHFCKVNSCTTAVFSMHKVEVGNIIQSRNSSKYRVEFGAFNPRNIEEIWSRTRE